MMIDDVDQRIELGRYLFKADVDLFDVGGQFVEIFTHQDLGLQQHSQFVVGLFLPIGERSQQALGALMSPDVLLVVAVVHCVGFYSFYRADYSGPY